jgi:hypothetical protein
LLGEDALDITLTRELDTQKFTPVHVYATMPNAVSNEARCAEGVRYRQTWSSVSKITVRDLPLTEMRVRQRIETCQFEFTCKGADGHEEIFIAPEWSNWTFGEYTRNKHKFGEELGLEFLPTLYRTDEFVM